MAKATNFKVGMLIDYQENYPKNAKLEDKGGMA